MRVMRKEIEEAYIDWMLLASRNWRNEDDSGWFLEGSREFERDLLEELQEYGVDFDYKELTKVTFDAKMKFLEDYELSWTESDVYSYNQYINEAVLSYYGIY